MSQESLAATATNPTTRPEVANMCTATASAVARHLSNPQHKKISSS